jgi:hypothetical protein
MTSKDRLVDNSRNPLARELLRSAELDEPPAQSMIRLALALGLGSSAVVSTLTTGAAAASEATLDVAMATATKGVAVASAAATGTGAGAMVEASASTAMFASTVSATNVAASTAALSNVGVIAAVPAVTSALSAVGMLKAMAVVSLTCGALSFGGTKLAMTIAEAPVAAHAQPVRVAPPQTQRATALGNVAPSVAAPESDEDDILPAHLGDAQHLNNVPGNVQQAARERNAGRDTTTLGAPKLSDNGMANAQEAPSPTQATEVPVANGQQRSAVAAFPSDDEPATPSVIAPSDEKARARNKPPKSESDPDLERVLLERARTAVAAGQPLVALQALDAYRTHARSGTLRAESVLLRVRALLALGQRSAAEREAMPLIKAAPQSRPAARLRELIGVPNDTP